MSGKASLKVLADAIEGAQKQARRQETEVIERVVREELDAAKEQALIEAKGREAATRALQKEAYKGIKDALASFGSALDTEVCKEVTKTDRKKIRSFATLDGLTFEEAEKAWALLRKYANVLGLLVPPIDVNGIPKPRRVEAAKAVLDKMLEDSEPLFNMTMDEARGIACRNLPTALAVFQSVIRLPDQVNYLECLVAAQQSRLKGILPPKGLFNVEIQGMYSSAKTYLLWLITSCADGIYVGGTTSGGYKRALERAEGATFGIDQFDLLSKTNPDILNLLLLGNQWQVPYLMAMKDEDGQYVDVPVNIGGPKFYTLYESVDQALKSRGMVIDMKRHKDARMLIEFLKGTPKMRAVKAFLMVEAERALAKWTREKVFALMDSPKFLHEVQTIMEKAKVPRDAATATTILLIGYILDWPMQDIIRGYLDGHTSERTKTSLYRETMVEAYRRLKMEQDANTKTGEALSPDGKSIMQKDRETRMKDDVFEVQSRRLWQKFNSVLSEGNHTESVGTGQWGHVLEELGFVKGDSWMEVGERHDSWRKKMILRFTPIVLVGLGIEEGA